MTNNPNVSLRKMKMIVRKLGVNQCKFKKLKTKTGIVVLASIIRPLQLAFQFKTVYKQADARTMSLQLPKILGFHAFNIIISRWS